MDSFAELFALVLDLCKNQISDVALTCGSRISFLCAWKARPLSFRLIPNLK